MPKREFEREVNTIQKVMADWSRGLGIADTAHQQFCSATVCLVKGKRNPLKEARPHLVGDRQSDRLHSCRDSGEPCSDVGSGARI
jgi:hypothetical protein